MAEGHPASYALSASNVVSKKKVNESLKSESQSWSLHRPFVYMEQKKWLLPAISQICCRNRR